MKHAYRIPLILFTNALLYFFLTQINALLAPMAIHLSLDALYFLFAAFYLQVYKGLSISVLTALVVDASLPVPFGTSPLLYSAAYIFIIQRHLRLRWDNDYHVTFAALMANLLIIVGLSFISLLTKEPWDEALGFRLLTDFFISQLVLALIAARYVRWQQRLLLMLGLEPVSRHHPSSP